MSFCSRVHKTTIHILTAFAFFVRLCTFASLSFFCLLKALTCSRVNGSLVFCLFFLIDLYTEIVYLFYYRK